MAVQKALSPSANKLTFQFNDKASFSLDGKKIDLGKATDELTFTGKDGQPKVVKGFQGKDGLFYALRKDKAGDGYHINVYGEPADLAKQEFNVRGGDVSKARFDGVRYFKNDVSAGDFTISKGLAGKVDDFASAFALSPFDPSRSLNVGAGGPPSLTTPKKDEEDEASSKGLADAKASSKEKEAEALLNDLADAKASALQRRSVSIPNLGPGPKPLDIGELNALVANETDRKSLPAGHAAINMSLIDSESSQDGNGRLTGPRAAMALPDGEIFFDDGEAPGVPPSVLANQPPLPAQDPRDQDLHTLMSQIADAKGDLTQWFRSDSDGKARIEKGLDERLRLVNEELRQRHQVPNPNDPVTDQTLGILKAQYGNGWIRDEASNLATVLNSLELSSLDEYLKSFETLGEAQKALETLRQQVVLKAVTDSDATAQANSIQSGFTINTMLSSVDRSMQDVKADGHCQFHSFAHAEGTTDFNSLAASDAQRETLLTTLASLPSDKLAKIAKSDLELADTYRILRTGIGQPSVGSDGWGRREHLQLKAIQTQRPVIALTPTSAVICEPDGSFKELTDKQSFENARARMSTGSEPLYIVHNGRDHWQSTVTASG